MRLIDADALRKHFEVATLDCLGMEPTFRDDEVKDEIDNAPTVDAAPVVHGRWIKMTGMMPPEYHGHYECSECQWHMKGLRNSWTREEELSYCPNCGAKMDAGGGEFMRLIDADTLKKSIVCSDTDELKVLSTKQLHKILDKWIDDRETIDAIPIDWLMRRMDETASGEGLNVELNNALFAVGVEWEKSKMDEEKQRENK